MPLKLKAFPWWHFEVEFPNTNLKQKNTPGTYAYLKRNYGMAYQPPKNKYQQYTRKDFEHLTYWGQFKRRMEMMGYGKVDI